MANIFISSSFPARDDPDFPEIHGNTAAALIRAIAGCARDFNLPADTPIDDIKTRFNLAAAFFLDGGRDVAADYDTLAATNSKTILAPLPKNAHAYADSGYQGYHDDHKDLEIPYKKSKKKPLTKDEQTYNHALSRFRVRVRVEHAIARLKRFRILSDRFRYPRKQHAVKFSIVAGIVNLMANA